MEVFKCDKCGAYIDNVGHKRIVRLVGRDYDQDFSTKELAEDAGDKLWCSYLKEDQDRLQALYMFDGDTRKPLKVWKKLTVG